MVSASFINHQTTFPLIPHPPQKKSKIKGLPATIILEGPDFPKPRQMSRLWEERTFKNKGDLPTPMSIGVAKTSDKLTHASGNRKIRYIINYGGSGIPNSNFLFVVFSNLLALILLFPLFLPSPSGFRKKLEEKDGLEEIVNYELDLLIR